VQRDESHAVGMLAGAALGGTGTFLQEVHQAVASRPFRALGLMGAPVRFIHDRIARFAYRGVSLGLGAVPRAGAAVIARATPSEAPALSDSLRGSIALGAVNGAVGDTLANQRNPLALTMSVRERGREVALDRAGLADAYPEATSRLAVFVHGLCETDEAWRLQPLSANDRPRRSYGSRLREDLGYTPLYLRYNTGQHISDNGRRLSELLEEVVEGWPVPIAEIALVGHSMGGLVARSACHYGHAADARWTRSVRHVFCLGSPHLGAPLEKAANVAAYALARLPETRPLARVVNGRSVGIKDLRFGSCVEEDWCDCDPDEFLNDRCREVPFLECATYYFVGATLASRPDGVPGSLVGDLLVRFPSASGSGRQRRIPFDIDHGRHLGGVNHFQLINHPAVYEQLRAWIEGSRQSVPVLSAHC
jgi:pimeloyl-ACP methyl ester carboxylesterase